MATVEENKTEKRSKLMEAAHSLFTSGSALKPPTIDEVVKMAGVAKGTFYLYFKDKYDLMDQLFLKKLAECVNSALFKTRQQLAGRQVEDAERVNAFLDNVFMYIDENKAFLPLIRDRVSSCYRLMLKGREAELKEAYDSLVKLFLRHGFTEYESEMNIYMLVSMLAPVSCDQPERKSGCVSRFTTAFCSRELSDGVFSIALSYFVNRAYPSSSRTHTTFPPSLN